MKTKMPIPTTLPTSPPARVAPVAAMAIAALLAGSLAAAGPASAATGPGATVRAEAPAVTAQQTSGDDGTTPDDPTPGGVTQIDQ